MSEFESHVKQAAESAVIKSIANGNWFEFNYSERHKIPANFMREIWDLVDHERIKAEMAKRIEVELADRVMNHLAAEMATDIKQLLTNQERREALRAVARENLDRIVGASSEKVRQQKTGGVF